MAQIRLSDADFILAYTHAVAAWNGYYEGTRRAAKAGINSIRELRGVKELPRGVRKLRWRIEDALKLRFERQERREMDYGELAHPTWPSQEHGLPLAAQSWGRPLRVRYAAWLESLIETLFRSCRYRGNAIVTVELHKGLDEPNVYGRCYPHLSFGDYTLKVRYDWRQRVHQRALAITERRFVLDAQPLDPIPYADAIYEAWWVERGRGHELRRERGLIVVVGDERRLVLLDPVWDVADNQPVPPSTWNYDKGRASAEKIARRLAYEAYKAARDARRHAPRRKARRAKKQRSRR